MTQRDAFRERLAKEYYEYHVGNSHGIKFEQMGPEAQNAFRKQADNWLPIVESILARVPQAAPTEPLCTYEELGYMRDATVRQKGETMEDEPRCTCESPQPMMTGRCFNCYLPNAKVVDEAEAAPVAETPPSAEQWLLFHGVIPNGIDRCHDDKTVIECFRELLRAEAARASGAPRDMEDPNITPLCERHAEVWYTSRNLIQSKSGCIACDVLAEYKMLRDQLAAASPAGEGSQK